MTKSPDHTQSQSNILQSFRVPQRYLRLFLLDLYCLNLFKYNVKINRVLLVSNYRVDTKRHTNQQTGQKHYFILNMNRNSFTSNFCVLNTTSIYHIINHRSTLMCTQMKHLCPCLIYHKILYRQSGSC